ncbi:hypothetical protein [Streptomyces chryseus]|uniref:hypothetical protein n=1 Tax=Streptomyces chryseus TaxID=68186 RepID=UPI00110FE209|nr:hypothetical protein [Streptomyces chryseus]GGX26971.1 hypothetical protein GCM10010353_47740 [Streptomyces chryseus]
MSLFTANELRTLLSRPLSDAQADLIHDLVEDSFLGEVGSRLTDPPQSGVKSVALAVAARALTNPEGVRSETAGALSRSYTDALTGVVLTAGELRRLRRAVGMASGAGSLNIGPDDMAAQVDLRKVW